MTSPAKFVALASIAPLAHMQRLPTSSLLAGQTMAPTSRLICSAYAPMTISSWTAGA